MGRAMLLMVSGLVIISGIIQMSNNNRTQALPERSVSHFYEQQAKNINASLIDNAIRNLRRNNDWDQDLSSDSHLDGSGSLRSYTQIDTTIAASERNWAWNQWKILLVSEASHGGYRVKSEVLLQRDSFSRFSYFTDDEASNIWFGDNDVLRGPVHTNGTFRMRGNPTFDGIISSPNTPIYHSTVPTAPQFLGGTNFNSQTKELPDEDQIEVLTNAANNGGLTFDEDVFLEFFVDESEGPDGEGYVKKLDTYEYDCSCTYDDDYYTCQVNYSGYDTCTGVSGETNYKLSDYNGLISVDGSANVKGSVKGGVTLHASQKITILGDLIYHDLPEDDPHSEDLLGLVSEGDVKVDRNAHKDHGSSDLTIHASIMALGHSFEVEGYNYGGSKGTLNILGGIIQNTRGPVGTSAGNGYIKNYVYDNRLRSMVPPEFPRESKFSIVFWKDNVVEQTSD